jgi:hypothetical protein
MPSSTYHNKEFIGENNYKKGFKVSSCSFNSLKRPSWKKIQGDIEVFDNGTIVVRTKKGWCELKKEEPKMPRGLTAWEKENWKEMH